MRGNDASLLVRCAIDGCGIVRVSRALIENELASGQLVELLKGYDTSMDSPIWAVYPSTNHVPPRLRAFIDCLSGWLRAHKPT